MLHLLIFDDRYFSCAKFLIFIDYHQFMLMMGDDPKRYLMVLLLPERYP